MRLVDSGWRGMIIRMGMGRGLGGFRYVKVERGVGEASEVIMMMILFISSCILYKWTD